MCTSSDTTAPQHPKAKAQARGLPAATRLGFFVALAFIAGLALLSFALGNGLFEYYERLSAEKHRSELKRALGLTLTPGARPGALRSERLAAVRAAIAPIFLSLPKNQAGRISSSVVRYLAHRYFMHKYGWHIKGFEPHKANATSLSDAKILQAQIPQYCEDVLEGSLAAIGFALDDAATLLAGVEQLIFDEVVTSVEAAYHLNSFDIAQALRKRQMLEVVYSVLIETMMEGNFTNSRQHFLDKASIREIYPNWNTMQTFINDIINADSREKSKKDQASNPFAPSHRLQRTYSFEETAQFSTRVSEEFGPWVNYECHNMKDALVSMDKHSTGRVKLSDFHLSSQKGQWHFHESKEYLQALGALDDSSGEPYVIIPNYLWGPSNCIMTTAHYSVCCLNECEGILRQLEVHLQAPIASTDAVLEAVEGILAAAPSLSLNGTRRERLLEIAAHNGGAVPIHGRLFAQWLHYVFPHECPYPHVTGSFSPKTPGEWVDSSGIETISVSDEDLEQTALAQLDWSHRANYSKVPPPNLGRNTSMWLQQEELLVASTPSDEAMAWGVVLARAFVAMALATALLVASVRLLVRALRLSAKTETENKMKEARATTVELGSKSQEV